MSSLLKTGCCGISLKKSTLIFGYVGIVFFILNLIGSVYFLAFDDENEENFDFKIVEDESINKVSKTLKGRVLELLINSIILLLACILMIIGVKKGNTWFLLPWIVIMLINIIGIGIILVGITILCILNFKVICAFFTLFVFFTAALYLYCWLIVVSYFSELRKEEIMRWFGNPAPMIPLKTGKKDSA